MPTYGFECYEDEDGCGLYFEIECSMDEISNTKPECPECHSIDAVARNFQGDVYVFDSSPKTVGALADRNASKISADEQHEIKTKNRLQKPKFTGSLPQGASLPVVNSDGERVASTRKGKDFGRVKNE